MLNHDALSTHRPTPVQTHGFRNHLRNIFRHPVRETDSAATPATNDQAVAERIRQIGNCSARNAPGLIQALRQSLQLQEQPAALPVDRVIALLEGPNWFEAVANGSLDLHSLLSAIGRMDGAQGRRALMSAIELALVRHRNPGIHDPRIAPLPAAAPTYRDVLPSKQTERLLRRPELKTHVVSITKLFHDVGTARQVGPIARTLAAHHRQMVANSVVPNALVGRLMPNVIGVMLARELISPLQEQVARAAAERVAAFAEMTGRESARRLAAHRRTEGGPRKPLSTESLMAATLDPEHLRHVLREPRTWSALSNVTSSSGPLGADDFRTLKKSLMRLVKQMETSGFLDPELCERFRATIPKIVEHWYADYLDAHAAPERAETVREPIDPAAFVASLRSIHGFDETAIAELKGEVLAFYRNGSLSSGDAFVQKYGPDIGCLIQDSDAARRLLAYLNRKPAPAATTQSMLPGS